MDGQVEIEVLLEVKLPVLKTLNFVEQYEYGGGYPP
jgi:hypothetical protein